MKHKAILHRRTKREVDPIFGSLPEAVAAKIVLDGVAGVAAELTVMAAFSYYPGHNHVVVHGWDPDSFLWDGERMRSHRSAALGRS